MKEHSQLHNTVYSEQNKYTYSTKSILLYSAITLWWDLVCAWQKEGQSSGGEQGCQLRYRQWD